MEVSQFDLEAAVKKTVFLHNRLESPQAVARVVAVSASMVVVSFSGPFCYQCGDFQKHIDDFAKQFKPFSTHFELVGGKAHETSPHNVQVSYLVKQKQL
jgi:hypothetical protein